MSRREQAELNSAPNSNDIIGHRTPQAFPPARDISSFPQKSIPVPIFQDSAPTIHSPPMSFENRSKRPKVQLSEDQRASLLQIVSNDPDGKNTLESLADLFGVSKSSIARHLKRHCLDHPEMQPFFTERSRRLKLEHGRIGGKTAGTNAAKNKTGMFEIDPDTDQPYTVAGSAAGRQTVINKRAGIMSLTPEKRTEYARLGGLANRKGPFKAGVLNVRLGRGMFARSNGTTGLTEEQKIHFARKGVYEFGVSVNELSSLLGVNTAEARMYVEKATLFELGEDLIRKILNDPIQLAVITGIYLENKTLNEVGQELEGRTREAIRQSRKAAIRKIEEYMQTLEATRKKTAPVIVPHQVPLAETSAFTRTEPKKLVKRRINTPIPVFLAKTFSRITNTRRR